MEASLAAIAGDVAKSSFPAFVAIWYMIKTNGKFDRMTAAVCLLTRTLLLSCRNGGRISDDAEQEILNELQRI